MIAQIDEAGGAPSTLAADLLKLITLSPVDIAFAAALEKEAARLMEKPNHD